MRSIKQALNWLELFEERILFLLIMAILTLSVCQILLRNIFESGLVWSEALIRLMVFWITLIGSMIASRSGQHICIDLISRYCNDHLTSFIMSAVNLITALLCMLLVYFSFQFLSLEFNDGTLAFADLPSWIFISIIPLSFSVMSLRYLGNSYLYLRKQRPHIK